MRRQVTGGIRQVTGDGPWCLQISRLGGSDGEEEERQETGGVRGHTMVEEGEEETALVGVARTEVREVVEEVGGGEGRCSRLARLCSGRGRRSKGE